MTLILTHLEDESEPELKNDLSGSQNPPDSTLLLDIETVNMQSLKMKLEYEREQAEKTKGTCRKANII